MDDPAVWITDNWSCGYYHWFCDALPRLEILRRQFPLSELTLLLPSKFRSQPYVLESLQAFGLKRVHLLHRFERMRCRELWFPSHVSITGFHDSSVMQSLRATFRQHHAALSGGRTQVHPRLYISRRLATRRCIANEHEILPVLADYGFQTIVAEQLSWREQLRLAAEARYLVSNHGAGLTNMLMMPAGSSVLEIREQQDAALNCYLNLASALRLNYYYLLASRDNVKESVHFADLIVDPYRLESALRQMLSGDAMSLAS
jgi:capsular polysaccharide biosynthesis protein